MARHFAAGNRIHRRWSICLGWAFCGANSYVHARSRLFRMYRALPSRFTVWISFTKCSATADCSSQLGIMAAFAYFQSVVSLNSEQPTNIWNETNKWKLLRRFFSNTYVSWWHHVTSMVPAISTPSRFRWKGFRQTCDYRLLINAGKSVYFTTAQNSWIGRRRRAIVPGNERWVFEQQSLVVVVPQHLFQYTW